MIGCIGMISFVRKYLSASGILKCIQDSIKKSLLPDDSRSKYSWEDCIMTLFAVFSLKYPSLLQFDKASKNNAVRHNLKNLFGINQVPSDTRLRERMDQVSPEILRPAFKKILSFLQRGNVLKNYTSIGDSYIVAIDGTNQHSSKKIGCDSCCEKHYKSGVVYHHDLLCCAIVHPDKKEVFPLAPEMIMKQDGDNKNDCEYNASKRLLINLRKDHPHLKMTIVGDGLYSNFPFLSLLDSLKMNYIIGAKADDHKYLFDYIENANKTTYSVIEGEVQHNFTYCNDVPLNKSHNDYKVNVVLYQEITNKKTIFFSWVTNLHVDQDNVYQIMRAGRARWRIENEVINVAKNQGYNLEHNYGHGKQYLCSMISSMIMLSLLMDQAQLAACVVYNKARSTASTFISFFNAIRVLIFITVYNTFENILYELQLFIGAT